MASRVSDYQRIKEDLRLQFEKEVELGIKDDLVPGPTSGLLYPNHDGIPGERRLINSYHDAIRRCRKK